MEDSKFKNSDIVSLLIESDRMLSSKMDKVFEEVTYLRHKLEGIDAGHIASLSSKVKELEDQGKDKEVRIRSLELHQNRWFGSKTVIVGLATLIITALISWGLRNIVPSFSPKDKAIPVLDKREERHVVKDTILD